ncbi:hypothetical protein KC19_2G294800 [Ceratodon purpureus]|uniref:Uncharacterized protein n=1 Tax=Ceratodon purpureus TaxID=3225 RepID=A0A8T0J329_CERPU|nr:hypothetical protein KC19_2G294800 [Ceratodon purpureus]
MAHSRHFYTACLDHRTTHLPNHSNSTPTPTPTPTPSDPPAPAPLLRLSRLHHDLAQFETRSHHTRHADDAQDSNTSTSPTDAMKQHVALLEAQLLQSDQVIAAVKDQLWGLEDELAQLQADQVALQLQLELDSANHARDEEEWAGEREELRAQVAHLETELHLAGCSDGELDFLITPAKKGHLERALSSPGTLHGLSLQTLLDMGEASLEVEEDIHELKVRIEESEASERTALHALASKDRELEDLKIQITQLKDEVAAEKDKAKEEAEDLTQEMAELRYQLMEMIEQERELRAQTEQASVLRVVELESQVKTARQEVVQALASRREAEMQSDRLSLEVQRIRLALQNADQELKESKEKIIRAQAEVEQRRKDACLATDARLKLENQLLELEVSRNLLITENQELKASLDRAFATTSMLEESLRDKEAALYVLVVKQSENLKNGDEADNSHKGACVLKASNADSDNEFASTPAEVNELNHDFQDISSKDTGVQANASAFSIVEMEMQVPG